MNVETAASQMEALGKPKRLDIYRALIRAGKEGLSVGALQEKMAIPGSTLSHHLKTLMIADLITQERQATTLICRANYASVKQLIDYLVCECCIDSSQGNADCEINTSLTCS
ncbi:ArsR family transcriptional regulator [Kiloniella spongiae]|uniref:ArsR family transcriptional regulator n=1 Tax=Kiloniella spongiae TaxID=1489064 RepID=A0A0H2MCZ7_9PROT|nr:metalloregulator ArsR/SmtB family transcription factor [Kiloniella spongiae]KLN60243.1 ArsR family transcriptional regulator [Kiloniella spongiae]